VFGDLHSEDQRVPNLVKGPRYSPHYHKGGMIFSVLYHFRLHRAIQLPPDYAALAVDMSPLIPIRW